MEQLIAELTGLRLAHTLLLSELLAASGIELKETHARLTDYLAEQITTFGTPVTDASNAAFSSALIVLDAAISTAQRRREGD